MSRNNTGNPIDSKAFPDFEDNVKNLDLAVNAEQDTFQDRLGKSRLTWAGMENQFESDQSEREAQFDADQSSREQEFDAAQVGRVAEFNADQSSREQEFRTFIASSGYQFAGEYADGIEITQYNQIIRDSNGEFWRVSGQVDLPYTATGSGLPEGGVFVAVGDAALRQELTQGATLPALSKYNFQRPQDAAAQAVTLTRKPHHPDIPFIPMGDMGLDGQAVHPCVVRTPGGFGPQGFRYWMAVTPYQDTNDQTENPCIYGSYDGGSWEVPNGVVNPLVPTPAGATNHNSDPCLLLHGNELWYYYRETLRATAPREDNIYLMKSSDGATWSEPVKCVLPSSTVNLSPSVVHDGTRFLMYLMDNSNLPRRRTSADGITWDAGQVVSFTGAGQSGQWHNHVVIANGRFEMLLNNRATGGHLIFCTSALNDGLNFVRRNTVCMPVYPFERTGLYQGCLTPDPESRSYDIWYSAVSGSKWTVAHVAATLSGDALVPVLDNQSVGNYGSINATAGHFNSISTRVPLSIPSLNAGELSVTGSTRHKNVILAGSGSATGTIGAVVGSFNSHATGNRSVIAASYEASATGNQNAVIASLGGSATNTNTAVIAGSGTSGGSHSAVIASGSGASTSANQCAVVGSLSGAATGNESVVLAGNGNAGGRSSAIIASDSATTYGTTLRNTAVIASSGVSGVSEVSTGDSSGNNAQRAAVIASYGSSKVTGAQSAVLSSIDCWSGANRTAVIASTSTRNSTNGSLAMGTGAGEALEANQRIRLEGISGTVRATNTSIAGLDYAELFPNGTGAEIPPGTILTLRDGAVVPAESGDWIVGVVSHTYGILGGDSFSCWQGRYLKDEWGRDVYQVIQQEIDSEDEPGVLITTEVTVQSENPDWDPEKEYISRTNRPAEWVPVGLLGQVLVRVSEGVKPGDSVSANNGIGVTYEGAELTGLRCMHIQSPYEAERGYAIARCLINVRV